MKFKEWLPVSGKEIVLPRAETDNKEEANDLNYLNVDFEESVKRTCEKGACVVIEKNNLVKSLLKDIKKHDEKTFLHSMEVGNMAAFLIQELGDKLTEEEKQDLISSALLHDYGKVFIDSSILNKKDRLTNEEFTKIKEHPMLTYLVLKGKMDKPAKYAVGHHEHQENSYPRKESRDLEKNSRILAIVDSFQSMLDPTRPSNKNKIKPIHEIVDELNNKFVLKEDKEIIFLLEEYYYSKMEKNERSKKEHNMKFN